jgi:hypothetical protein
MPAAKRRPPRADRHPVRGVLVGKEGIRVAAVQVGLDDRAAVGVGPVQVCRVDRHPDRGVLAGDDGTRAGALKFGTIDRAVPAAIGVGSVQAVARDPPTATPAGLSCRLTICTWAFHDCLSPLMRRGSLRLPQAYPLPAMRRVLHAARCSAAPVADPAPARRDDSPAPQAPRPAEPTPGLAGLNVVRPRAAALRALHADLAAAPALTGTYPGKPAEGPAGSAPTLETVKHHLCAASRCYSSGGRDLRYRLVAAGQCSWGHLTGLLLLAR